MKLPKEWANVRRIIKFALVFREVGLKSYLFFIPESTFCVLMGKFFRDFASVVDCSGDLVF